MAELTPYASIEDLEKFWKPISDEGERTRATDLLKYSSNYLRQVALNNSTNLDTKISEDDSGIYAESVKLVVLESVKRAMLTPSDAPPANQWSQSASPYSESMTFTNPGGDLFIKKNELLLLGLGGVSGKSQFGLLRAVRGGSL